MPDGRRFAISIAKDVGDRLAVEAALKISQKRLQALVEANMIGLLFGDTQGNIQDANAEFLRMVGYTSEDLAAGRLRWIEITPPEYLPLDEQGIRQARDWGACVPYEKEYICQDGSRVPVLIGYALLAGSQAETVAFVLDLTKQKAAEAEILQLNAQLEQRVRARTAQLEAANRELEAFSYSVSHDLRAPIRHIGSFVQLLQQTLPAEALNSKTQRYLTVIAEATRKAGLLIDQLLRFSRNSRAELRCTQVNLNELVREICHDLTSTCPLRQIDWQIRSLPVVWGDSTLLRLVLQNLLDNAVKYTRYSPQARITMTAETSNTEHIIHLQDNGVGFNMKYAHKLFGVFQRLHREEEFEGTGIGLANVQRIIHRHGGRVWAAGEPGRGAIFRFPCLKHPNAQKPQSKVAKIAPLVLSHCQAMELKRILLVEDNLNDVELILLALAENHLANEVVVARDGEEALDYLYRRGIFSLRRFGNPILVMLDLKLPKIDGLEVLRAIKTDRQLESIPVVILTSSREEQDIAHSYRSGSNAYVVKPLDFREFITAVRTLGLFWALTNEPPPGSLPLSPN
ncbi:MAG: response regulator [Chloroflexaceae bacterium]|nr:response regulator [Chloroflexaceae bacterium]